MTTICLVGGSGFVGTHLLNHWGGRYQPLVLSRNPDRHRDGRVAPRSRFHAVDGRDADALALRFAGAGAVVNLVGILNESGHGGAGFSAAHVEVTRACIDACRQAGVSRLLQMSALNAGQGDSHYLRTKGEAEALVRESGLDWTLFQPSVIFGPGDSFLNRFAALLRMAPLGLPLACPDARLQPVYIGDVCRAFDAALTQRRLIGRTLELGGPQVMRLREIVDYLRGLLDLRRPVIGLPDGISRLMAMVLGHVPGKPFSIDNYRSLQVDNVTRDNALPALGIEPTPMAAIAPRYLGRGTRSDRLQRYRTGIPR